MERKNSENENEECNLEKLFEGMCELSHRKRVVVKWGLMANAIPAHYNAISLRWRFYSVCSLAAC